MSYLGKVALKASDIRRLDVTSSTSATHTLTWTPPNEQSLIITINGVKQQNNYSISGVTLTLDSALVATDEMEVIGINDIGTTTVPGDGTVTTSKIEDDAVTADKLANSINTEIAANTAKVTNATHTGDVTGATALTIAAGAVDLPMLSATGTASSSTFLRGDNAWAAAGVGDGDVTVAKLSTSATEADNVKQRVAITRGDGWDPNTYGAMSESGGVWTFPTTAYYKLEYNVWMDKTGSSGDQTGYWGIYTTPDDGTYTEKNYVQCIFNTTNFSNQGYYAGHVIFDVASTSTHKCKFGYSGPTNTRCRAGSPTAQSYVTFSRLGST